MKSLKAIFGSLLIMSMFVLVACGSDASSSTESTDTEVQEAPVEEQSTEEAPAEEQSTEEAPAEGEHPEGSEHPAGSEHPSN